MKESLQNVIKPLTENFQLNSNEENGTAMSKYMKYHFPFFGIKATPRREIYKLWSRNLPKDLSSENKWEIIFLLWNLDEREYQHTAIDWLNSWPAKSIQKEDGLHLEYLLINKSWWDSVDSIASNFLGKYITKYPQEGRKLIDDWRNSPNFWLNRSCLIFQLKYGKNTDFDLLKDLIIQFNPNKEFFIQKAIGWSLRQYSKFKPYEVKAFLHQFELKGIALREASKYI